MEEGSMYNKEEITMQVNFADGTREELIRLNLLSRWDDCTVKAREEHDEEIRVKYNRLDNQGRLDNLFNR